uniref:Taste receptor type 2 n=1 Tax=Leptobrachium leishanense TaxID=445787 RepID=A0A8C5QC82_9ANUR
MDITACLVTVLLEAIIGLAANVFIVSNISINYLRGETMSSINKILLSLGISNMCFAVASSSNLILSCLIPSLNRHINIVSCALHTLCLCVFHFIKIVNFSTPFLSWVKTRITAVVSWLILVSEVVSVGSSIFITLEFVSKHGVDVNVSTVVPSNGSWSREDTLSYMRYTFVAICLPVILGFVIICWTIAHLKHHGRRMKVTMGASGSASVKAHQTAANTMIRLLTLYAFIYIDTVIFCFDVFPIKSVGYWFSVLILISFTPAQSVLLITGNPKLKGLCCKMLCLQGRRDLHYKEEGL